ncbi:hypothetical protein M0R45_005653 [Rubus argutus]|uniref:Uncharacterized protein n=1 Tax=Rubus argutus TaxID=59490 RepID=A0AAW1YNA6_RUBAR
MSLGGAKRAGVVQASKRPPGHNLGCVLRQRRHDLPFTPLPCGIVIGGFLICTAIGYLVYAKNKPEASVQEVARVSNIADHDDTGRKGTSINAVP